MTLRDWKHWSSLTVGYCTSTVSKPLKQKFPRFSSTPLLFKDSYSIKAQTVAGPTDHVRGIRGLLIWKKWVESVSSTPNLWTGYFRRSLQNKTQLHIHFSLGRTYCTKPQKLHDLHVKENRKTNLHSLHIDLERQQSNASFHQLTIRPNVCSAQRMKL